MSITFKRISKSRYKNFFFKLACYNMRLVRDHPNSTVIQLTSFRMRIKNRVWKCNFVKCQNLHVLIQQIDDDNKYNIIIKQNIIIGFCDKKYIFKATLPFWSAIQNQNCMFFGCHIKCFFLRWIRFAIIWYFTYIDYVFYIRKLNILSEYLYLGFLTQFSAIENHKTIHSTFNEDGKINSTFWCKKCMCLFPGWRL